MIKAYIFDLDGTLHSRTGSLYKAMSSRIKWWFHHHLHLGDIDMDKYIDELKKRYPAPFEAMQAFGLSIDSFHQEVFSELRPEEHLVAEEALRIGLLGLSGEKFLVTLASRDYASRVLRTLGIEELFSEVFTYGANWNTRNKFDAYEEIRLTRGLEASEVCVVGDNYQVDLRDAKDKGYYCVEISERGPNMDAQILRSVANLPELIRKDLLDLPDDTQMLVASFFVTNEEAMRTLKKQWSARSADHGKYLGRSRQETIDLPHEQFGGSIVLLDPKNLERGFLKELSVPVAFGLCHSDSEGSLYVTSGATIWIVRHGKCVKKLSNTMFNDLHALSLTTSGNLLVASTGVDGILEVDCTDAKHVFWDWLATEQGYNTTPAGRVRIVDRTRSHQTDIASTPEHTTHINSAISRGPSTILATLFHQGELIEIERVSKRHRVVLQGLRSPHNIRRRKGGYMLSDSRANRVLLLDQDLQIVGDIRAGFQWVQDAVELNDGSYLVGDSNNDRVVRVNSQGKLVSSTSWPSGSRKFAAFELISVKAAREIFSEQRSRHNE